MVQTVEHILLKNLSSFVYNHISFVFSQFSLSAVFMRIVALNWLSHRDFESSEIRLLFTQIFGPSTNISTNVEWWLDFPTQESNVFSHVLISLKILNYTEMTTKNTSFSSFCATMLKMDLGYFKILKLITEFLINDIWWRN